MALRVPFLSSAQASLSRSRRREVGERKQKTRKGGWEEKKDGPRPYCFSIISILDGIPSGSLFGGERRSILSIT